MTQKTWFTGLHLLINLPTKLIHGVTLMKKLTVILAFTFMLGACDTQEANQIVEDWHTDCQGGISNRHLGNFACAFHTFGRIIEYPFTR